MGKLAEISDGVMSCAPWARQRWWQRDAWHPLAQSSRDTRDRSRAKEGRWPPLGGQASVSSPPLASDPGGGEHHPAPPLHHFPVGKIVSRNSTT